MCDENDVINLIDLIYGAVLDSDLWQPALDLLADTCSAEQAVIATLDRRASSFVSIQKRAKPQLLDSYQKYWAFRNPLWAKSMALAPGELFSLDSLIPREEFAKMAICNEWWVPAGYSFAMLGTNLHTEENLSSLVCIINAHGRDALGREQARVFGTASKHIGRAQRVCRELWSRELKHGILPERAESLGRAVLLTDGSANVIFANALARDMLKASAAIAVKRGCLMAANGTETLHRLIASCAFTVGPLRGPFGGALEVQRGSRLPPVRLTVTPLRPANALTDVPWLGLRAPVALVTIDDPDAAGRQLARALRERYGLTAAEAALATEIVKGDGRAAAAKRRGISIATARSQLSSIFEKTGTNRQAELVHLLLGLMDRAGTIAKDERREEFPIT